VVVSNFHVLKKSSETKSMSYAWHASDIVALYEPIHVKMGGVNFPSTFPHILT